MKHRWSRCASGPTGSHEPRVVSGADSPSCPPWPQGVRRGPFPVSIRSSDVPRPGFCPPRTGSRTGTCGGAPRGRRHDVPSPQPPEPGGARQRPAAALGRKPGSGRHPSPTGLSAGLVARSNPRRAGGSHDVPGDGVRARGAGPSPGAAPSCPLLGTELSRWGDSTPPGGGDVLPAPATGRLHETTDRGLRAWGAGIGWPPMRLDEAGGQELIDPSSPAGSRPRWACHPGHPRTTPTRRRDLDGRPAPRPRGRSTGAGAPGTHHPRLVAGHASARAGPGAPGPVLPPPGPGSRRPSVALGLRDDTSGVHPPWWRSSTACGGNGGQPPPHLQQRRDRLRREDDAPAARVGGGRARGRARSGAGG